MGDLNGTYNQELETEIETPTGITTHSRTTRMGDWLIRNTINDGLLADKWRLDHPHDPGFTKTQTLQNKNVSRSRLDYILTSPNLTPWFTVEIDKEHSGLEQLELNHHPIHMTLHNFELLPKTTETQPDLPFWIRKHVEHKAAKAEHWDKYAKLLEMSLSNWRASTTYNDP